MSKEWPGRKHGGGKVIDGEHPNSEYFYNLDSESSKVYQELQETANRIMKALNINGDPTNELLLALKQRLMIGYSNGCPWPERAVLDFIKKRETQPASIEELTRLIRESAKYDAHRNLLFQILLEYTNETLKTEMLSYHEQSKLDEQENYNVPPEMTNKEVAQVYGLAYDPLFFDVIDPLMTYIETNEEDGLYQARYFAVMDFFAETASTAESIEKLIELTKEYIDKCDLSSEDYSVVA